MNKDYERYTNAQLSFDMYKYGKIKKELCYKETGVDASKIFDVKMFFLNYPATVVKVGEKWESTRKIHDFVFSSIKTTHTLKSIEGDSVRIGVRNVYQGDDKLFTK
jgi:Family of unknown function (DUF6263)